MAIRQQRQCERRKLLAPKRVRLHVGVESIGSEQVRRQRFNSLDDKTRQPSCQPLGRRLQCGRPPAEDRSQRPRQRRERDNRGYARNDGRGLPHAISRRGDIATRSFANAEGER